LINWFDFLRQHNVPFTTVGPNASRGRVNIKCPYCGDDPSEHLGISLSGRGWSCWRNPGHRGRDQARLVTRLLGVSLDEARRLLGGAAAMPSDADMLTVAREKLGGRLAGVSEAPGELELFREFKSLSNGSPMGRPFLNYLEERGYYGSTLNWLVKEYSLHYATTGRFAYRIIIPVYDRWRNLLTWTGRSIRPDEELRYKALSRNEQVTATKQTLLGLPALWAARDPQVLIVTEGPFDAFWLSAFGRSFGVYATCLFGLELSDDQLGLLEELRERFPRVIILLDSEAQFQAFRFSSRGLGFEVVRLSSLVKDPASLSSLDVIDLCVDLRSD
jgi:hypothetical protein